MISSMLSNNRNMPMWQPSLNTWNTDYNSTSCKKDPPRSVSAGIRDIHANHNDAISNNRDVVMRQINDTLPKYSKGVDYHKYQQTLNNDQLFALPSSAKDQRGIIPADSFKELMQISENDDFYLVRPEDRLQINNVNSSVTLPSSELNQNNSNVEEYMVSKIRENFDTKIHGNIDLNDNWRHSTRENFMADKIQTSGQTRSTHNIDLNDNWHHSTRENFIADTLTTSSNAPISLIGDKNDNHRHSTKENYIQDGLNVTAISKLTLDVDTNDNHRHSTKENYIVDGVVTSGNTNVSANIDLNDNYRHAERDHHVAEHIVTSAQTIASGNSPTDNNSRLYSYTKSTPNLEGFQLKADSGARVKLQN